MVSSIRSVCLCHVFSDLANFETQLDILLFFKSLPPHHPPSFSIFFFLSLPDSSLTLSLGFPGLCSVSNLHHFAGPGVFHEEPNG